MNPRPGPEPLSAVLARVAEHLHATRLDVDHDSPDQLDRSHEREDQTR